MDSFVACLFKRGGGKLRHKCFVYKEHCVTYVLYYVTGVSFNWSRDIMIMKQLCQYFYCVVKEAVKTLLILLNITR